MTLNTSQMLALTYWESRTDFKRAIDIIEEVFHSTRDIFGQEHPRTIEAMSRLALCLESDGRRTEEGIQLREKVLDLGTKIFGSEHYQTIEAISELAMTLCQLERQGTRTCAMLAGTSL
jgi:hypothetical protein